ncbi:MAG: restriction endonuclease [Roseivirga sp.]|nr:restriction endonuclease [Roseivirga sp.]
MSVQNNQNTIFKVSEEIPIHSDFMTDNLHEYSLTISVENKADTVGNPAKAFEQLENEKLRVRRLLVKNTFQNPDLLYMIAELPNQQQINLYECVSDSAELFRKTVEKTYQDFKKKRITIDDLSDQVMLELQKRPKEIQSLSSYKFELFVGSLLEDQGWNIEMTPKTRDHGRDIIATIKVSGFSILTVVECKKWREDRPVGIDVLERFIFTVRERDRANFGLLATSSYFSRDSRDLSSEYNWLIKLEDFEGLKKILTNYGKLKQDGISGLWLPDQ